MKLAEYIVWLEAVKAADSTLDKDTSLKFFNAFKKGMKDYKDEFTQFMLEFIKSIIMGEEITAEEIERLSTKTYTIYCLMIRGKEHMLLNYYSPKEKRTCINYLSKSYKNFRRELKGFKDEELDKFLLYLEEDLKVYKV